MATCFKDYFQELNLEKTFVLYRISDGMTYLCNKHTTNDTKHIRCHMELTNWHGGDFSLQVTPLHFIKSMENKLSPMIDIHEIVSLSPNVENDYFVQEVTMENFEDESNDIRFMLDKFLSWKLKMKVTKANMLPLLTNLVSKGIDFLETGIVTNISKNDCIELNQIAGLVATYDNALEVTSYDNAVIISYLYPNNCYFGKFSVSFSIEVIPVVKPLPDGSSLKSFKVKEDFNDEKVALTSVNEPNVTQRPLKLKQAVREDFEQAFKKINPKIRLERAEDGGYVENYVELCWAAYRKSFNMAQAIHRNELLNKGLEIGKSFLVAGFGDNDHIKKLKVSRYPRFHNKLDKAESEAQRLANTYGGKFVVYAKIGKAFVKQVSETDAVTSE